LNARWIHSEAKRKNLPKAKGKTFCQSAKRNNLLSMTKLEKKKEQKREKENNVTLMLVYGWGSQ